MPDVDPVGEWYVAEIRAAGVFAVRVADEIVPLLALDPAKLAQVERAAGVPWTQLLEQPTRDLTAALMLIVTAETHEDAVPVAPATVADLLARFVRLPARNGTGAG